MNSVAALLRQEMALWLRHLQHLSSAMRYKIAAGGSEKGLARVAAPVAGDGIDDGTAQALRLQGRRPRTASGQVLGTEVHTESSP